MATKPSATVAEPNPTFGKIPLKDVPGLLLLIFAQVPATIFAFFLKRPTSKSPRPWGKDLKLALIRRVLLSAPISLLRQPATAEKHAVSKRYKEIGPYLNQRVVKLEFAGWWVCRTSFRDAPPSDSDVVILFIHGGGYVTGHPVSYTTFNLRIAETISAGGKTVSVFSLQYSLAPESVFPTQLSQAAACYEYLVNEMNISAEKIALVGDSAGGSIALSLVTHLQIPYSKVSHAKGLAKPGKGLYLVSPWVSLFSQAGSEKEISDVLPTSFLDRCAGSIAAATPKGEVLLYTDFITSLPERGSWSDVFPMKIWLSVGEDEMFAENVTNFYTQLKTAKVDVSLSVEKGQAHDWQFGQSLENEKKYLEREFGTLDDGILSGADEIGKAILGAFKTGTAAG